MAPCPPLIPRCRRFGISSFTEDEFRTGSGGKSAVSWSESHGVCAYHERSKEYYRLVEGSQLNELCANVDDIAEHLRRMIISVENDTSEAVDEISAQLGNGSPEWDEQFNQLETITSKALADMDARLKAVETSAQAETQKRDTQLASADDRIIRLDATLDKLDDLMIDRFASRDTRLDDLQRRIEVYDQHNADLTALLTEAAERISSFDAVVEDKVSELQKEIGNRVDECVSEMQATSEACHEIRSQTSALEGKVNAIGEAEEKRIALSSAIDAKLGDLRQVLASKVDSSYVEKVQHGSEENRQQITALQQGIQLVMGEMVKWRKTVELLHQRVSLVADGQKASPSMRTPSSSRGNVGYEGEFLTEEANRSSTQALGGKKKSLEKSWNSSGADPSLSQSMRSLRSNVSLPDIHSISRGRA